MIFQTTIQRFFNVNGVDYARAIDVENDIIISNDRSTAYKAHHKFYNDAKYNGGSTYESHIANPNNTTHIIHHTDGTRSVIKTIAKQFKQ